MRPCAGGHTADRQLHHAELATATVEVRPPVQIPPPNLGGELSGGQYHRTNVEATSAPPPCPPPAPAPQRPATHPSGRRITLLRDVPAYPLHDGRGADVAETHATSRPAARQLSVEQRGVTLRAAPDVPDPSWSEVAG